MMVMGVIVCKIMRIDDIFLNRKGILILPGMGITFTIIIVQILNLLIPVSWICYPYLFFMGWGMVKYHDSISCCLRAFVRSRRFLILTALILIIWTAPLLEKTELVSIQTWNNDIIYYLASMEWLKDNNSLSQAIYDSRHPLYWCAEYMLNRTRIGFDGYGAFIMSLFGLKAHEVFSSLGMLFGLTALFHIYYLFSVLYKLPLKIKTMALIIIALSGRIDELLIYQYIPHLFGISLLILFISLSVPFFMEPKTVSNGMVAFILSGIITVYAEFCVYIFALYIGMAVIAYCKGRKDSIRKGWLEGIAAVMLNPPGTYRALKINLYVLLNTGDGMGNIDPFDGKMESIINAFTQLIGACGIDIFSGVLQKIYLFLLAVIGIFLLFVWGYYFFKIKDEIKIFCALILIVLGSYEVYFRVIKYGYGEYKHLLSATLLILALSMYAGYQFMDKFSIKRIGQGVCCMMGVFLLLCGIYKINNNLLDTEFYYFDNTLIELENAAKLVPETENIGISGKPASVHGMVYALKNHDAIILSNNVSYFPYSEMASSRYQIYEGEYKERESSSYERYIWGNGRFYLIENTNLQAAFYTGFHNEYMQDGIICRDTCDKESSIIIYNFSDETKYFSIAFQTEALSDSPADIKLMVNGKNVSEGVARDYIFTDMLMINPDENIRLFIYYDGDLTEHDGRSAGFSMKEFKLVTYAEE